jgi:Putative peptidoglycan binding domain
MADELAPAGTGDTVVQPGDSLISIAAQAGLLPDSIWNDPANAALKEARKDGEVLLPGDRLTVRDLKPKEVGDAATAKTHVFRRKGIAATVTIYVQDDEGEAFAGKKYELIIDGTLLTGTTGDDGKIEAPIKASSRTGELKVWLEEPPLPNPWIAEVHLGELVPVGHTLGVQQRLSNLGFYRGELDGEAGPATLAAVTAFQTFHELTATGEIDQATRDKLVEIHKS